MSEITLGQYLRLLRIHHGWSQRDVASQANISVQLLRRWENNRHAPTMANLNRLAQVFEIPLSDFTGLTRPMERKGQRYQRHSDPERVRCRRCTIYLEEGDDFEGRICAECVKDLEKEAQPHGWEFRPAIRGGYRSARGSKVYRR